MKSLRSLAIQLTGSAIIILAWLLWIGETPVRPGPDIEHATAHLRPETPPFNPLVISVAVDPKHPVFDPPGVEYDSLLDALE